MWPRTRLRNYKGQHVCITGGSDGLGLALAKLFVEEGANLSLIARTPERLKNAKKSLEQCIRKQDSSSKIVTCTGDCSKAESVSDAIRTAVAALGSIDILIANAGRAAPGRFAETEISDFESQIQLNYLGIVYTVKSVIEGMIKREKGEIVLISSVLGVLGMTGYSAYAPTKWALRGFADCLRMEMQAYNISVRIAYPPNMRTNGYEAELLRTPREVKDIMDASGDVVFSASDVAKSIIKGMKQDKYHLPSPDTLQTLSQAAMTGLSPASYSVFFQAFINCTCAFLFAYFVNVFDKITKRHKNQRDALQ